MTDERAVSTLHVEGELTIYRAAELCADFRKALAGDGDLEVHLAMVTEMDSAGLQLLVAARKAAVAAGRGVRLVAPSPAVREVFGILDPDAQLGLLAPTEEAA